MSSLASVSLLLKSSPRRQQTTRWPPPGPPPAIAADDGLTAAWTHGRVGGSGSILIDRWPPPSMVRHFDDAVSPKRQNPRHVVDRDARVLWPLHTVMATPTRTIGVPMDDVVEAEPLGLAVGAMLGLAGVAYVVLEQVMATRENAEPEIEGKPNHTL
ncbi:hypothetical protein GUJ93_ZPchr0002g25501 [Zizania palustris]|uniref:Uncharacterized protein n=1 Tax=Zizania palustris TaxID=103762 RepID=A0A8J5VFN6_ZIZPA|nr:hypothetical protein GUJ93_ZPchr0002g25501 [Zizania palustris]